MIWNERPTPAAQIFSGARPAIERPFNVTVPSSGTYMPEIRLKAVVLPAPFGPMRAWSDAVPHGDVDALDGFDAAEMLGDPLGDQDRAVDAVGGPERRGQGLGRGRLPARHRGVLDGFRAERPQSRSAMPTRPVGEKTMKPTNKRPNQNSQFWVQIERNSRKRMKNNAPIAGPRRLRMPPITTIARSSPEKAMLRRVGRGEAVVEHREDARDGRHARRDRESEDFVAVRRIADEARALLVLADRDEHAADRGVVKPPQRQHDQEADRRHEDVVEPGLAQIDSEHDRTHEAAEAVLAAGERGPAEGDGVQKRRQRQGQQGEIHAAAAQDQEADEPRHDEHEGEREQRGQDEAVREPGALRQRRRIARKPEEGAVPERDQAGVADEDVEAETGDGEDDHIDRRRQGQAGGEQSKRQSDEGGGGGEEGPGILAHGRHSKRRMRSPNRPRGRTSRISAIRA